jgi:hypothetical protein
MEDADSSPTLSESHMSALVTEPVKKAIAEASRTLLEAIERAETIYGSEVGRTKGKSPKMTIQEASEALIEAIKVRNLISLNILILGSPHPFNISLEQSLSPEGLSPKLCPSKRYKKT